MAREIDEATLIKTCAERGRVVTTDQLKRWRLEGVLQRSRQEHVPGLRGSRSWSPVEAVDQARTVDELLRARRRDFDDVRLELWRRGAWVDRVQLRETLARPLAGLAEAWNELLAEAHGDRAVAVDLAMSRFGFRDASSMTRLMLQRLGGSRSGAIDMRNVVWFFFLHGFGADDGGVGSELGSVLESAVAVATGLARARGEVISEGLSRLPGTMSATDVILELRGAGAFDIPSMAARVACASDAELDRARDDVILFAGLATIVAGVEAMRGTDVAGLGSVRALASDAETGLPFVVNTMLVLRRVLGDAPFEQIQQLVDDQHARYSAIVAIDEAVPGIAAVLGAGEDGLARLSHDERETLRLGLAELFARQPELEQQLG